MTGHIFLNYRRDDSAGYAGRLYDRLSAHFGGDAVFMDVSTIDAGVDFVEVLQEAVHSCDVLITVIGPQWLSLPDEQGNRRLDNPEDFVRIELAAALERDIRVIPALVGGTVMPRSDQLPENLKALSRRNAFQINHQTFHTDTERLIQQLETALAEAERKKARRQERAAEDTARLERQRQIEDLLAQAELAMEAEEWSLAEERLNQLLALDPRNRDARARLEIVRRKRKAQEKAERELPAPPEEQPEPKETPARKVTPEPAPEDKAPRRSLKQYPQWVWGVVGSVLVASLLLGSVLGGNWFSASDPPGEPGDMAPTEVAAAATQTPAATQTLVALATETTESIPLGGGSGKIAFVSNRGGNFDIWLMDRGGNLFQLTDDSAQDYHPVWSPDGTKIAFASDRSGNYEIWLMDADGGNLTQLTDHSAIDQYPAWSPDSSQIAFFSERNGKWNIWLMNLDGRELVQLTGNLTKDIYPSWSPDGEKIAFTSVSDGNGDIWIADVRGGSLDLTQLTADAAQDSNPAWSPDGSRIAFSSNRSGDYEIWLMSFDGEPPVQITDHESEDYYPAWSPDGNQIAFVSNRSGNYDLWLMDKDGSNLVQLTDDTDVDYYPAWQPAVAEAEEPPESTLGVGSSYVNPIDSAIAMYIPAGSFMMGSEDGNENEQPVHEVYLDAFWMYQTEVTNAQYRQCVETGVCKVSDYSYIDDRALENNPVVGVDWFRAQGYCEWADGRLPTEAEWEKAARGGLEGKAFPWGDEAPNCTTGAFNGAQFHQTQFDDCNGQTAPAGNFKANGYGLYDMAGNVWEWVADWYDSSYYYSSPGENPQGPESGEDRGIRGGSWYDFHLQLRSSYRSWYNPDSSRYYLGFRCVIPVNGE